MFKIYSSQTGSEFGVIQATNETEALDKFAQKQGYENARAMWSAGRFEYVSAHKVA